MADRTRLAAAGLFLALALAVVPALLPVDPAGADLGRRAEAAAATVVAAPPQLRLRGGDLTSRLAASAHTSVPEDVLHLAISEAAPRSHTVASGETLWKISQDAGIGIEALAAANQLTFGAILRPGQVLVVPAVDAVPLKASARTHEVAPGETLWGISGAWGVRAETLAAANHMSLDAVLHPGQILVVPGSGGPRAAAPQPRVRGSVTRAGLDQRAVQYEPLEGGSGPLVQPSEGLVTSRFGWRIHPIFGTREFHTGLDIANRMGTPVRAAEDGVVRFVGWMGGYGRLIIVTHANGLETSYSHLSAMLVTLGQRVVRGQLLARMGNTGWSTGPHLLFEVRRNGVPLDPVPFLTGAKGTTAAAGAPAPSATPVASASPAPSAMPVAPASVGAAPAPTSPVEERRSISESRSNTSP